MDQLAARNRELNGGRCACYSCMEARLMCENVPPQLFIVCEMCGNKRCPKATDHSLQCTGSNEPGQAGSRYQ